MANYSKHTWSDGEIITASNLNNIENQVEHLTENGYVHPTYPSLTGIPKNDTSVRIGDAFEVSQTITDTTGHVAALNTKKIDITPPVTVSLVLPSDIISALIENGRATFTDGKLVDRDYGCLKIEIADPRAVVSSLRVLSRGDGVFEIEGSLLYSTEIILHFIDLPINVLGEYTRAPNTPIDLYKSSGKSIGVSREIIPLAYDSSLFNSFDMYYRWNRTSTTNPAIARLPYSTSERTIEISGYGIIYKFEYNTLEILVARMYDSGNLTTNVPFYLERIYGIR